MLFMFVTQSTTIEHTQTVESLPLSQDKPADQEPSTYHWNASTDLQNPELPSGCEATALSTTLRLNGIEVDKNAVADAMPKTAVGDYVNAFWGDPYSSNGWACMSPCIVETAKKFISPDQTVVNISGTDLTYLPAPCVVWVTMGMESANPSNYQQDGYTLLWNTHCVTFLHADELSVTCIDPLEGLVEYPFSRFNHAYLANGKQAVYITNRNYTRTVEGE